MSNEPNSTSPNPEPVRLSVDLDGRSLSLESGKIAKQADGSCVVRFGDTVVLATACANREPREGIDFFPLTVDYKENTYAGGIIPGGWFKREGRPTEKETLTSRLIDRPLRPLFPEGFACETQVIAFVLSADGENDSDVLALNAASAALTVSDIPFHNPVGAVRVGLIDGAYVINPTNAQRDLSQIDLIVAGTDEAVVMVEAGASGIAEGTMLEAIWHGHAVIRKIVAAQHELARQRGTKKRAFTAPESYPAPLFASVVAGYASKVEEALQTRGKFERKAAVKAVYETMVTEMTAGLADAELAARKKVCSKMFGALEAKTFRDLALEKGKRVDGRRFDEIRPIACEVGMLPRTHGSALFTRGETQALVTATLGTSEDAQIIEDFEGDSKRHFLLHYNFPPFSVGEVKFLRGPSRREIGHGNLARRALEAVVPPADTFPYVVRVVSDILESNGSSSMATICGGSLAMMDAGVPVKAAVAGVAMGLIKEGEKFAVLTDIAGIEDHEGDMDFKVAGTREGVTALQMDIKIGGISKEIMAKALDQAKAGRLHILGKMETGIAASRSELSPFAPRIETITIPRDRIRDVIGSGGKTIRQICEETGAKIEVEDSGRVNVASASKEARDKAVAWIKALTTSPDIGTNYEGTVRRIEAYGAFVEIMPGQDGLLHISEMTTYRLRDVTDIFKEGDKVEVKVIDIDPGSGKIRLSRKAVLAEKGIVETAPEGSGAPSEGGDDAPRRDDRRDDRRDGHRGGPGGGRGGRGGGGGRR
jgi:polyribonucleotide nucleotidyltransferase